MSSRLLKEDDVIRALHEQRCLFRSDKDAQRFAVAIEAIPSADRPQGEWITYYPPMSDMQKHMCGVKEKGYVPDKRFGRSKCSLCGCGRPMYEDNYCPGCGTRMKTLGETRRIDNGK